MQHRHQRTRDAAEEHDDVTREIVAKYSRADEEHERDRNHRVYRSLFVAERDVASDVQDEQHHRDERRHLEHARVSREVGHFYVNDTPHGERAGDNDCRYAATQERLTKIAGLGGESENMAAKRCRWRSSASSGHAETLTEREHFLQFWPF